MKKVSAFFILVWLIPPLQAQPLLAQPMRVPAATGHLHLQGTWYYSGNFNAPCQVIPLSEDQALFINEHGDRQEGFVRGNRIIVPGWRASHGALTGNYRQNVIVWSNGTFWSR